MGGKDASKQFWKYHNAGVLKKYQPKLKIGSLDTKKAAPATTPAPAPTSATTPKKEDTKQQAQSSPAPDTKALDPYGELIPFSDPSWYHGVSYYTLGQYKRATNG